METREDLKKYTSRSVLYEALYVTKETDSEFWKKYLDIESLPIMRLREIASLCLNLIYRNQAQERIADHPQVTLADFFCFADDGYCSSEVKIKIYNRLAEEMTPQLLLELFRNKPQGLSRYDITLRLMKHKDTTVRQLIDLRALPFLDRHYTKKVSASVEERATSEDIDYAIEKWHQTHLDSLKRLLWDKSRILTRSQRNYAYICKIPLPYKYEFDYLGTRD